MESISRQAHWIDTPNRSIIVTMNRKQKQDACLPAVTDQTRIPQRDHREEQKTKKMNDDAGEPAPEDLFDIEELSLS
jgi:hypothetical protein